MNKIPIKIFWSKTSKSMETYIGYHETKGLGLFVKIPGSNQSCFATPPMLCVILLWRTAVLLHRVGESFHPYDVAILMHLCSGFSEDILHESFHPALFRIKTVVSARKIRRVLSQKIPPEIPDILLRIKKHTLPFDFSDSFHTVPIVVGEKLMKWNRRFRDLELMPPSEYKIRQKRLSRIHSRFSDRLQDAHFDEDLQERILVELVTIYDRLGAETKPALIGASIVFSMIDELEKRNLDLLTPQKRFEKYRQKFVSVAAECTLKAYPDFCPQAKLERSISALVLKVFKRK